ncbi:type II CRISPR-associated endonuclease Cas1 [Alterisphingorhabdus coralli]|uniref:CRISPR-associated endonuclease Cas1 n=1 Tax=Alterisphingorhabdus coralli TaxID=3071408 RepID=A0AA97F943_9SPHN|nr:type II CRISPR-associated endonuclease Cas1 [Parasphingorhabdus sp. SCSIO 66989]WOE75563.1 type II CRISPR-associated endonuclease Cas1 [Parasphingorhabdus sp. SCSIO 66989]
MAWRGLHISNPARLNYRNSQIVVAPEGEEELSFPVEDIVWIILDTVQLSLTCSLLSALAESGVALIVPDSRHHPAGMLLSFHQHHAQAAMAHDQIAMTLPLQKRLWQRLVRAKIENQAAVLRDIGDDHAEALSSMVARVGSGDPANMEAQAARAYWPRLFEGFRRHDQDRRNGLLNYGYAVVRAALARACAASGLLPAFGIHHRSRTNAFNLVDDCIEPFRPCVDRYARKRSTDREGQELDVTDRRHMAAILNESVFLGEERLTVLAATEAMIASLVRAINGRDAGLLQVPFLPLARHD